MIRRSVGMDIHYFKPDKDCALLLIDRAKHEAAGVGISIIVPTDENRGQYCVNDPEGKMLFKKD